MHFDRTLAEHRQLFHRCKLVFKKHLSGGRNKWRYGSTSAVRLRVKPDRFGVRLDRQVTVLD